jgi:hypothetical protein
VTTDSKGGSVSKKPFWANNIPGWIPAAVIILALALFVAPASVMAPFAYIQYCLSPTKSKVAIMTKASSGCGNCMNGYDLITGPEKIPELNEKAIPALVEALAWDGNRALGATYRSIADVELWNLGEPGREAPRNVANGDDQRPKPIALLWLALLEPEKYENDFLKLAAEHGFGCNNLLERPISLAMNRQHT